MFRGAIARAWLSYREHRASICGACLGWGEIGHGEEHRYCNSCADGIIRGQSWGQLLDEAIEVALAHVGIEADENW